MAYKDIKKIVDSIVNKFKPEKVILFGSYAWGNPGPDSDVDLFIVKDTNNIRETARNIDGSIFPRIFPIDIIVYSPDQLKEAQKKDFFIRDILQKGLLLYEKQ